MLDELTYQQGRGLRDRIAWIVCSAAWLDAVAPESDNGFVFYVNHDIFPPGGDATTMRKCAACKRTSPPHAPRGICCDCEVEQEEFSFLTRLENASEHRLVTCIASERDQLRRRWWRPPIRFAVTPTEDCSESADPPPVLNNPFNLVGGVEPFCPLGEEGETGEECPAYDEHSGNDPSGSDRLPQVQRPDRHRAGEIACHVLGVPSVFIHFFDPIPRSSLVALPVGVAMHVGRLAETFDRQLARSVRAATTAFRKACRPLDDFTIRRRQGTLDLLHDGRSYCLLRYEPATPTRNVSIGSGRSAGCVLQLLPESESGLKKEIEHAQEHGDAAPSAKRFTHPNPYLAAPEDFLGLRAFYRFRITLREREEREVAHRCREPQRKKAKRKARKAAKQTARKRRRAETRRAALVAIG